MSLIDVYWLCFIGGTVFAVLLLLLDQVIGGWIDGMFDVLPDALHPIALVSGIVAFGGAGLLLSTYSSLNAWMSFTLSVLAAVLISISLFFFYVKPMSEAESSIAYSVTELPGKLGEVSVPIPVGGYGEVGFTFGHGVVYEIASSTEEEELKAGERVLAIEVKDRVVVVCRWTGAM